MYHLRQVLRTLHAEKFYANSKKCAFSTDIVIFLGFVISSERVSADPEKVKAITEWPQPCTIREVRTFHKLVTFYRRFINNFSVIMTPISDYLKSGGFQWTLAAAKAFKKVKRLMIEAHVMHLSNFLKALEVTCDASELAIGNVLSQENHLIAYFNEKLNDARQ